MDETLIERYEADGFVAVPRALEPRWIESLRDAIPEMLAGTYEPSTRMGGYGDPGDDEPTTRQLDGMWRGCEPFARFLFQSPVGDTAATFMRSSSARLYEDLLLYKRAGAPGGGGWHRDAPHWPVKGTQLSSIWFSLESVTRDTGAMRFVVGSHRDGEELVDPAAISVSDAEVGSRPVATVEAEPGDVVVFHPRVVHTAYGSAPDHPRRTFTLRFMGDDVRWRPRRSMFHPWMRDCGLEKGDPMNHPWFPEVARSRVPA